MHYYIKQITKACVHAKSLQSCPTLCDPVEYSPRGSSVHRILQARILKWVAIPFSRAYSKPRDCSPPGSSVHRILQARILGWVATSFSDICTTSSLSIYHMTDFLMSPLLISVCQLTSCYLFYDLKKFCKPCSTFNNCDHCCC